MTTTVNVQEVSKSWSERGYSCDVWIDPPGQRWEDYVHATDELVMVIAGDMEFEINGKISRPAVGVEVTIPAGTVHSVRNAGATTGEWLYGYN